MVKSHLNRRSPGWRCQSTRNEPGLTCNVYACGTTLAKKERGVDKQGKYGKVHANPRHCLVWPEDVCEHTSHILFSDVFPLAILCMSALPSLILAPLHSLPCIAFSPPVACSRLSSNLLAPAVCCTCLLWQGAPCAHIYVHNSSVRPRSSQCTHV